MQLHVTVPTNDEYGDVGRDETIVSNFRQIVTIGALVARSVRDWLRQIPMTPHVKQRNFYVSAEWIEDAPKVKTAEQELAAFRPKRKRKGKK